MRVGEFLYHWVMRAVSWLLIVINSVAAVPLLFSPVMPFVSQSTVNPPEFLVWTHFLG